LGATVKPAVRREIVEALASCRRRPDVSYLLINELHHLVTRA
jgi:hypothetical protein